MYTIENAIANALKNGIEIVAKGWLKKDGRRLFWTTSGSDSKVIHCVHHTYNGFECDCKSYEFRKMCAHIGRIVLFLQSLTIKERTTLLTPRKIVKPIIQQAIEVVRSVETATLNTRQINTTPVLEKVSTTERSLPKMFMR